jgi:hypothetical protein
VHRYYDHVKGYLEHFRRLLQNSICRDRIHWPVEMNGGQCFIGGTHNKTLEKSGPKSSYNPLGDRESWWRYSLALMWLMVLHHTLNTAGSTFNHYFRRFRLVCTAAYVAISVVFAGLLISEEAECSRVRTGFVD